MQQGESAPEPSRSGERRRRRGLYGAPVRLTASSPLVGRLLWYIGDWGRASEHIGARWESMAVELIQAGLLETEQLLVLGAAPELMAAVFSSGLPHADAARAWLQDGLLMLEPLDFKWSLETASVRQVGAPTLARLLAAELPALTSALDALGLQLGAALETALEPTDGRFVAPVHPANQAALKDDPHLPVLLLPVDAQAFFRPLSAWATALAVARLERTDLSRLTRLDAVERYYRIGAGVAGALTRLETGLFEDQPAEVAAPQIVDALPRHTTLNAVLQDLERRLKTRRALDEQLHLLPRAAYPFGRLRADLERVGVPRRLLEARGPMGRLHGAITREIAVLVRAAGRELVAAGNDDLEALRQLNVRSPEWSQAGTRQTRARAPDFVRRAEALEPAAPTE